MPQSFTDAPQRFRLWRFAGRAMALGDGPRLMGILNCTPDSFSDGGNFLAVDAAVSRGLQLIAEGAELLDLGGESTRPNSTPVTLEDELRRVIPVVERLARETDVPLSIDTTKSAVARQALAAGAHIVNDISGLTLDAEMAAVCREFDAGVICMHMQGTPQTMQQSPTYTDVVGEIAAYLGQRFAELTAAGLRPESLVLDPGIGFGKTADHNLQILANIDRFRVLGPVCIGHSRKRFLGKILARPIDERNFGTVGVSLAAAVQGADILRLHEIAPTRACWRAWQAVMKLRS